MFYMVPVGVLRDVHETRPCWHLDSNLCLDELGKVLHPLGSSTHADKLGRGREKERVKKLRTDTES